MEGASRDRVTIDLRGIGDVVRSAAAGRGQTVAAFARQALLASSGPQSLAVEQLDAPAHPARSVAKVHLRMDEREAEVLILKARALGLSYGEYVGRLVTGTPLPPPVAQRDADRAALRRSCDQLAALAGDINALIRLIRLAKGAEAARQFGDRMRGLEADVRRHIDLASRLVARPEDER
jgi:hypothetical protein